MSKKVVNKIVIPLRVEYSEHPALLEKVMKECFADYIPKPAGDIRFSDEYKGLRLRFNTVRRDNWSHDRTPPQLRELKIERQDSVFRSYYKRVTVTPIEGTTNAYLDKDDLITKVTEMARLQAEADKEYADHQVAKRLLPLDVRR